MLPSHLQISLVCVALLLILLIIWVVRKGLIQLKYSLLWLGIGFGILGFSFFPELALFLTHILGIDLSVNAFFFVAIILILLLIL